MYFIRGINSLIVNYIPLLWFIKWQGIARMKQKIWVTNWKLILKSSNYNEGPQWNLKSRRLRTAELRQLVSQWPGLEVEHLPSYPVGHETSCNNQGWWWGGGVLNNRWWSHVRKRKLHHVWLLWQPATSEARSRGTESYIVTCVQTPFKVFFFFFSKRVLRIKEMIVHS
jgi:hypothetical protein